MKNRGVIYNLIWLDKGENIPERYEYFTCPSAIYEKYTAEEIGMTKGSLLNIMSKNDNGDAPIIYSPRNGNLRIVRAILYGKNTKDKE